MKIVVLKFIYRSGSLNSTIINLLPDTYVPQTHCNIFNKLCGIIMQKTIRGNFDTTVNLRSQK